VKFAGPAAAGVPVIAPAADNDRPAGRDPFVTDQEYAPLPPLAERVWLYAVPTVPFGSADEVTLSGVAADTANVAVITRAQSREVTRANERMPEWSSDLRNIAR